MILQNQYTHYSILIEFIPPEPNNKPDQKLNFENCALKSLSTNLIVFFFDEQMRLYFDDIQ